MLRFMLVVTAAIGLFWVTRRRRRSAPDGKGTDGGPDKPAQVSAMGCAQSRPSSPGLYSVDPGQDVESMTKDTAKQVRCCPANSCCFIRRAWFQTAHGDAPAVDVTQASLLGMTLACTRRCQCATPTRTLYPVVVRQTRLMVRVCACFSTGRCRRGCRCNSCRLFLPDCRGTE